MKTQLKIALILLLPAISVAQAPVDEDGNIIGQYEASVDAPLLSQTELQDLVGPIALYPDDLLAIVLPAAAYPLQIVEAARFLEAYETDSSLEPSPDWDEAVVALTNYPEIVQLLNDDLDWTLRLGEAVVAQQTDVIAAIEGFRDRAYAAGNLKSDEYQTVSEDDGVIHISPVEDDAIYVPYYEPEQVVYYQPEPVYYYYPRARPVYYYPYAAGYNFHNGYFWGVTTAFTIGWLSDSLHTYHYSYHGHPYYGRSYWNHWYRRPSISVYNTYYTYNNHRSGRYRSHGDIWRAREQRREYIRREGYGRSDRDRHSGGSNGNRVTRQRDISFRDRDANVTPRGDFARNNTTRSRSNSRDGAGARNANRSGSRDGVSTRSRNGSNGNVSARNRDNLVDNARGDIARGNNTGTQTRSNSRDSDRTRGRADATRDVATARTRSNDRSSRGNSRANAQDNEITFRSRTGSAQQPASRSSNNRRAQQVERRSSERDASQTPVSRRQQASTRSTNTRTRSSNNRSQQQAVTTPRPSARTSSRQQPQASRRQPQATARTSSPRRQSAPRQAPRSAPAPQPRRQAAATAPRQQPQRQSSNRGASSSRGESRSDESRSRPRSKRR